MDAFWAGLNLFEKIYYCIALPFSAILVIQLILSIVGLGHHGDVSMGSSHSVDTPHDTASNDGVSHAGPQHHDTQREYAREEHESISTFKMFTLRGFIAFFAIAGWTGVALAKTTLPIWADIALSVAAGWAAMAIVAAIFSAMLRLQSDGTLRMGNTVGQYGTVYIRIPANRQGKGKVQLVVQEQLTELFAATADEAPLSTGEKIKVLSVEGGNTLLVTKANK